MSRTSIKIKTLFTEYEGQMGQEITVKGVFLCSDFRPVKE